jgi:hypothetical protein
LLAAAIADCGRQADRCTIMLWCKFCEPERAPLVCEHHANCPSDAIKASANAARTCRIAIITVTTWCSFSFTNTTACNVLSIAPAISAASA